MTLPLVALSDRLAQRRHRSLLWIDAERAQGAERLAELRRRLAWAPEEGVLIGDQPLAGLEPLPGRRAGEVLGRSLHWAVYDAFCGFNPNHFAQLAGALAAGGWLVLLSPPAESWPAFLDPEYRQLCVEPWTVQALEPRFLRRLVARLLTDDAVVRWHGPGLQLPQWPAAPRPMEAADGPWKTADQAQAVSRVLALIGQRRGALVITADRGRGKSAAIGLALTRCQPQRPLRVLLTAPSWQATESLRERLAEAFGPLHWQQGVCTLGNLVLHWMTPARLAALRPAADLLVIDEAAAIATPLLRDFSRHYRRLIFATTTHGYEGNGRGFALRFRAELAHQVPRLHELELKTPIRWAPGDPLEATVNRLLLLDAEPGLPPANSQALPRIDTLERQRLVEDDRLLRELFGLLILAHYRTTPGDLRILLDSPNLQLRTLRLEGALLGCVLLAEEGELSPALAEGVWQGVRRPTGHLLPQALIAHEGYTELAPWRAWRVVRIAMHPAWQQRGLGSRLLQTVVAEAAAAGVDYLGASFAATPELLHYWGRNGFVPLRVGDQLDPVAASHAAIVLRPLSERCRQWLPAARQHSARRLRYRLSGTLASLPVELLPPLFAGLQPPPLDQRQWRQLQGFADHRRSLESSLLELDQLLLATVARWPALGLEAADQCLLVERIWRQKAPEALAEPQGARAQLQRLRQLAARLLRVINPAV